MTHETVLAEVLASEGRTQTWLAKTIGAHPNQVNDWAKGKHVPTDLYKKRIAQALGRSIEELFYAQMSA